MDGYDNPGLVMTALEKPSNGSSDDKQSDAYSISMDIDQNGKVVMTEKVRKINGLEPNDKYDPYAFRNVKHPTSFFDTLIHLLKASLGTGILAMPCAFKNAGYVVGTLGTIVMGILCTYTIHLLVSSSYELSVRRKIPFLTYPATASVAFEDGPENTRKFAIYARFLTNLFLILYQLGASCVYVVFISSNLKAVVDSYTEDDVELRVYMLSILVPLILISWVRNLKLLSPFSSIANTLTVASFVGIFYYIFREAPSFQDREPVGSVTTLPLFFGTVLFAMEAIGVVLPLENEMANPRKFGTPFGVLNLAMVPISALYLVVGLFGYMKYGENAAGSITLDLPKNEIISNAVKLTLSMSIYICYALSNYVAFDIMWKGLEHKLVNNSKSKTVWEYGFRTSLVLVTFALAVVVPNLEDLISLIGALCLPFVGIALPAIINFLTFINEYRAKGDISFFLFCLRNLMIVIFALFTFIIGVTVSLSTIVDHMT